MMYSKVRGSFYDHPVWPSESHEPEFHPVTPVSNSEKTSNLGSLWNKNTSFLIL